CCIPVPAVADISDRRVVVGAPEERRIAERQPVPQHVAGCDLPLPLCHDPMFDPRAFAGNPVRPFRRVSGGEDAANAGFQTSVASPASTARLLRGFTPMPTTTMSAGRVLPLFSTTFRPSMPATVSSR